MKVPAVNIEITETEKSYVVTATPWGTLDASAHPFRAELHKQRFDRYGVQREGHTADSTAKFVRKLMATYPKVSV